MDKEKRVKIRTLFVFIVLKSILFSSCKNDNFYLEYRIIHPFYTYHISIADHKIETILIDTLQNILSKNTIPLNLNQLKEIEYQFKIRNIEKGSSTGDFSFRMNINDSFICINNESSLRNIFFLIKLNNKYNLTTGVLQDLTNLSETNIVTQPDKSFYYASITFFMKKDIHTSYPFIDYNTDVPIEKMREYDIFTQKNDTLHRNQAIRSLLDLANNSIDTVKYPIPDNIMELFQQDTIKW